MNRRGFLGRLAAALATATVARKLPAAKVEAPVLSSDPADYGWKDNLVEAHLGTAYNGSSVVGSPSWATATYDRGILTVTPSRMLTAGTYGGVVSLGLPPDAHSIPVTYTVIAAPKRKRGRRRGG